MVGEPEQLTRSEERDLAAAVKSLESSKEDKKTVDDMLVEIRDNLDTYPDVKDKQTIETALRDDAISAMKESSRAKDPKEKAFLIKGAAASKISADFVKGEIDKQQTKARFRPKAASVGTAQSLPNAKKNSTVRGR
jgi:hypothetical protein